MKGWLPFFGFVLFGIASAYSALTVENTFPTSGDDNWKIYVLVQTSTTGEAPWTNLWYQSVEPGFIVTPYVNSTSWIRVTVYRWYSKISMTPLDIILMRRVFPPNQLNVGLYVFGVGLENTLNGNLVGPDGLPFPTPTPTPTPDPDPSPTPEPLFTYPMPADWILEGANGGRFEVYAIPEGEFFHHPDAFKLLDFDTDEFGNALEPVILPGLPDGFEYGIRLRDLLFDYEIELGNGESNLSWNLPADIELGRLSKPESGTTLDSLPLVGELSNELVYRVGDQGSILANWESSQPQASRNWVVKFNKETGESSVSEVQTQNNTPEEIKEAVAASDSDLGKYFGTAQQFQVDDTPLDEAEEAIDEYETARTGFFEELDSLGASVDALKQSLQVPSLGVGSQSVNLVFGEAVVNLQVPSWIRDLFRLAMVIVAFFAARSMISSIFN